MIKIHVDGATIGKETCGVAAIAYDGEGRFLGWLSRSVKRMTNMEAEYHAALVGLELARRLRLRRFVIVSDAEVMVRQVQGKIRVLSQRLRPLHRRVGERLAEFPAATFQHVPREMNRMADALAADASEGRTVHPARSKRYALRH